MTHTGISYVILVNEGHYYGFKNGSLATRAEVSSSVYSREIDFNTNKTLKTHQAKWDRGDHSNI